MNTVASQVHQDHLFIWGVGSFSPYILLNEIQIILSQLANAIIRGLACGFVCWFCALPENQRSTERFWERTAGLFVTIMFWSFENIFRSSKKYGRQPLPTFACQLEVFEVLLQFDSLPMFLLRQGSYKCSPCKPGFIGDGYLGCYPGDLCTTAQHTRQVNAQCSSTGAGRYKCTVRTFN